MAPTHTDEGLVAAEGIRRRDPSVGVLVLSHYLESRYAMRLLQQHPERIGYLLKERVSDIAVLTDAVRRVAEGECVIDPTIVARLMARQRDTTPLDQLTDRERDVLVLMAEGHSNHEMRPSGQSDGGRGTGRPAGVRARCAGRVHCGHELATVVQACGSGAGTEAPLSPLLRGLRLSPMLDSLTLQPATLLRLPTLVDEFESSKPVSSAAVALVLAQGV
jgi:hypothetical protein